MRTHPTAGWPLNRSSDRHAWALALALAVLPCSQDVAAESRDLSALETVNRSSSRDGEAVYLNAAEGDGVAWISGLDFTEGRISLEVKGADNPGRSFVGVAFHGADNETYDVVYVRPFNFNAADAARRAHSLQYVSMPAYPWQVLRETHPGCYEAALTPPPDPDSWIRLDLEFEAGRLSVFVNGANAPALEVDTLSSRSDGRIGLWVGNNSDGWFRNLDVASRS